MNKLNLIVLCIMLISLTSLTVCSLSLLDYPGLFLDEKGHLDITIVVGDMADASDTIGSVEIATSLNSEFFNNAEINAVIASEIYDAKEQNMIVIGGPCANSVAAELMNYPIVCSDPINPNTGLIKLYDFGTYKTLLIAGFDAIDTRRASTVLANYDSFEIPNSSNMEVVNRKEKRVLLR